MKRTLLLLLAAGTLASCGTKPQTVVEGTVTGIADSTKVWLLDYRSADTLAGTVVSGGKFRLEIAEVYPDFANLRLEGLADRFQMFVEPGTITVTIDPESTPKAVYTGTESNDRLIAMNEQQDVFLSKMREMTPVLIGMQQEGKSYGDPAFDSLLAVYRGISGDLNNFIKSTVEEKPGSMLAAYIMFRDHQNSSSSEVLDSVLNVIAGAPANGFTDRLRERRDMVAQTAIGAIAPDFTQTQPDGEPFTLSSLRGKLVLIDFWASWCGPCRAENPNVVKVYEKYHDQGFEIVGVSLDDNRENWLKAIEDDGLVWKHVSDLKGWNNAVSSVLYGVRAIPHTVLVGPDGAIIAKNLRGPALEAKVAEVLTGATTPVAATVPATN